MRRIICIGQRYRADDDVGPRVFDLLSARALPAGVECIDGGLVGLGLLARVEHCERVVFVDSVAGFAAPGELVVLDGEDRSLWQEVYGHDAGLGYLLAAISALRATEPSTLGAALWVVGVEGPADEAAIVRAARRALELAQADGNSVDAAPQTAHEEPDPER